MSDRDTQLDDLLDGLLEKFQRGEIPDHEALCATHPEFAEDLRRLLPSLLIMEGVKPVSKHPADCRGEMEMLQQLGEYRILSEIGRGGMGVVYEAEQTSLGRRVALKMLPHLNARDQNAVNRFEREARAAARLHHTNIVPVFEVGQSGDSFYYTMQLIQGASLDCVLEVLSQLNVNPSTNSVPTRSSKICSAKGLGSDPESDDLNSRIATSLLSGRFRPKKFTDSSGPNVAARDAEDAKDSTHLSGSAFSEQSSQAKLSTNDRRRQRYRRSVARIGLQAAEALAYSHAHGIVHRDIKPANLILDEDGVVWITDFGLAMTEDSTMTQTGDVLGTLRYLAPERFEGKCTERSDVYSLGVTLYELLALRPAFGAQDRLHLIESIRTTNPTPLRESDPGIPRDLETIVLKACDREPDSRYISAAELSEDLSRFLSDEPIKARRASISEQTVRWARRNQQLAGSLLAITVLLGLFAAGASIAFVRESRFLQQSEIANDRLQRKLYAYEIQRADGAYRANNLDVVRNRLDECPQELRDWEWNRLDLLARPKHVMSVRGFERPAFTPDGRYLITAGHRGDKDSNAAKVWDLSTGQVFGSPMRCRGKVTSLALTADGKHLVTGAHNGMVAMWDFDSRRQLWSLPTHADKVDGTAFSPDGARVATVSWDQTLKVLDTKSGSVLLTVGPMGHRVRCAEFSPSGKQIAAASYRAESSSAAKIWDASTGNLLLELRGHAGSTESLAFSPDGRRIITGGVDGAVKLWNSADGALLRTYLGHRGVVSALAFHPRGDQFASGSKDRAIRIWDVATAQEMMRYRTGESIAWLSYARDGRKLASFGSAGIKVWESEGAKDVLILRHGGRVLDCEFSPNGQHIASSGDDGTIKIWELATGMLLRVLRGHEASVHSLAWQPGGGLIASASYDETTRIWEPESGRLVAILRVPGKRLATLAFSPDGTQLAIGAVSESISVFDVSSRNLTRKINTKKGISSIAWSLDGQYIASGHSDEQIMTWSVSTGERTKTLEGGQFGVAFTPDGSGLIAGSRDGTIRLFDVLSGVVRQQYDRHQADVRSLALSPNGRRLVSGATEVKIWDADSGEELFSPREHRHGVHAVSVSTDGTTIASAATDGTVAVWESTDSSPQWQTRNKTGRASRWVDRLFDRHTFQADVLVALDKGDGLDPELRDFATAIATRRGDEVLLLFKESWSVVLTANNDSAAFELARRKANAACVQVPDSPAFRTGLGVAEYRLGRYEAALDSLHRARNSGIAKSPVQYISNVAQGQKAIYPVNTAFLAMTLHQLNRVDEARKELNRLRELLRDRHWSRYLDATLALREAEQTIADTDAG